MENWSWPHPLRFMVCLTLEQCEYRHFALFNESSWKNINLKDTSAMELPFNHAGPGRLECLWRIHRSCGREGPRLRQIHGAAGRCERSGEAEVPGTHCGERPRAGRPVFGLTPRRTPFRTRRPRWSVEGINWFNSSRNHWLCFLPTHADRLCFQSCLCVSLRTYV